MAKPSRSGDDNAMTDDNDDDDDDDEKADADDDGEDGLKMQRLQLLDILSKLLHKQDQVFVYVSLSP